MTKPPGIGICPRCRERHGVGRVSWCHCQNEFHRDEMRYAEGRFDALRKLSDRELGVTRDDARYHEHGPLYSACVEEQRRRKVEAKSRG